MKASINQEVLLEALKKVWLTVSDKKDASELHKCFCFANGKVSSFNGRAGLITKCELGGLSFIVKADVLYPLIRSLNGDIELTKDVGALTIKCGKHKTKVGLYNSDSFFDVIPSNSDKFCDATNIIEAIKKVKFTISTNKAKPELCGVAFYNEHVYSCDNKRITRVKLNAPVNGYVNFPASALEVLESVGQPDYLFISGNGLVGFLKSADKTIFTSAVQAGLLPVKEIDAILSKLVLAEVTFPDELTESIKRLKFVCMNNSSLAKMELSCTGGQLTIHVVNPGIGEASETLDFNCAKDFKIYVHPESFQEALKHSKRCDFSEVFHGTGRYLRFLGDGFDHVMGLSE